MRSLIFGLAAATAALSLGHAARAGTFESANARGLCIDIGGGSASLQPCRGGGGQDFDYSPGQHDRIRVGGDQCLAVAGEREPLVVEHCHKREAPEQMWSLDGGGQLQSGTGLCVDADGGSRDAGTPVIAYRCNGQDNQRWNFGRMARGGENGSPPPPGYPPPPPPGYPQPDRGGRGNGEVETMLSPRNANGSCLEVARGGNNLIISGCDGHSRQRFTYNNGGAMTGFQVKGLCVTAPGGPDQPPFVDTCTGSEAQHWYFGGDGSIRNTSGLCLHVLHGDTDDGSPVIVSYCERGAAHQEWDPR